MGECPKFLHKKTKVGIMKYDKRDENKSAKSFRLPKNILRFVDDFFAANCEITPAQEKAFAETRRCVFEAIKCKRKDPNLVFFQTARELLDFFDLIESSASSITMYQRKKFRTAVTIYKELLIGEQERRRGVKTLADLDDPIACVKVAEVVKLDPDNQKKPKNKRKRPSSYNLARKLRRCGFDVVKAGNRCYCESRVAAYIFPEYKKYLKKLQLEE